MEATPNTHRDPPAPGAPTPSRPRRVTVMGLGHFGAGIAAARYFASRGCQVTVTDLKGPEVLAGSVARLAGVPVSFRLGGHEPADFTEADLVVTSPAVPPRSPFLKLAAEAGVRITSEMNLFFERCPARIVGVTGTSGKSTTTTLLADALARTMPTRMGGNIGRSLLEEVAAIGPDETVVLELSSFQLAALDKVRRSPHVAVVTGFAPNHLDWHETLEHYRTSKQAILKHQGSRDVAVLNADDPEVAAWAPLAPGRVVRTSAAGDPAAEVRADGPDVVFRLGGDAERMRLAGRLHLLGRHNVANVLLAAAAARLLGTPLGDIAAAVAALRPLPHRLQPLGRAGGVQFVDDSKATTPEAAAAGLAAVEPPVVLIAGGYDKQVDPAPLIEAVRDRAAAVVLMGATAPVLAEALAGALPVERAEGMADAVRRAVRLAGGQGTVLLSPGHASWDMFEDYEARGRAFADAARDAGMCPDREP